MSLREWAQRERWTLTIDEADEIERILEPIGEGVEMSGDHRPPM